MCNDPDAISYRCVITPVTPRPATSGQLRSMMLKLSEVVRQMRKTEGLNQPRPFSIVFATANRARHTGGDIRELNRAVLLTKKRTTNRIVDLQVLGTTNIVRVHLDLILYFNNRPVA